MKNNFKKLTISVAASAVLVGNAFALDPAITNFGYVNGGNALTIFNASDPTKIKIITGVRGKSVGISPTGAWFYRTNEAGSISKYDAYSGEVADGESLPVGTLPVGITISADGTKGYVSNKDDGTVSVIDTATHAVLATVAVGTNPRGISISPDGTKVYVGNYGSNTVSVINTATDTITATIAVGTSPVGISISPDGTKVYVSNNGSNTVSVINTATDTITATIAVGTNPYGISISPDGTKVYVGNYGSNTISVINTTTNEVIHTIADITYPTGISVSPDGAKIYVSRDTFGDYLSLYVIDATTYAVTNYESISTASAYTNISPFISPNLLTGTLEASSSAELETKGFANYVNMAGGTLKATGSFTLSKPVYLHDEFNLQWDDSSTFTTVAGGTVDTNGHDVNLTGNITGVGGLTKSGSGTLGLSGTNSYSGATTLSAGTLYVSGSTDTASLSVADDTTLKVDANASGASSSITTSGSVSLGGGILSIATDTGSWSGTTSFTLINATGGVSGTFDSVSLDKSYLSADIVYEANAIKVNITKQNADQKIYNNNYLRYDEKNVVFNISGGLIWQDNEIGSTTNWSNAITRCEDLSLGGYDDWRLPNYNELSGLVDRSKTSPSLASAFSYFADGKYWTSTTNGGDTNKGWSVSFSSGEDSLDDKADTLYVRCVRGGE